MAFEIPMFSNAVDSILKKTSSTLSRTIDQWLRAHLWVHCSFCNAPCLLSDAQFGSRGQEVNSLPASITVTESLYFACSKCAGIPLQQIDEVNDMTQRVRLRSNAEDLAGEIQKQIAFNDAECIKCGSEKINQHVCKHKCSVCTECKLEYHFCIDGNKTLLHKGAYPAACKHVDTVCGAEVISE